ncbi:ankyrin-2 [Paramyrothecium foliicola]|nr:ankyrin-2 [Paramyrothecium foliicola]
MVGMLLNELCEPQEDVVLVDRRDFADFNTSNILPQPKETLSNIRTWLNPTAYADDRSEYQKHLTSHLYLSFGNGMMALTRASPGSEVRHNLLGHWRPGEIKVIITSRPVVTVERIVRTLNVLDVRLDKSLIKPDILSYLLYRLDKSSAPPESHSTIVNTILKKADGLFLYAKLALNAILELPHHDQILETLYRLPTDLAVMYENLLGERLQRTRVSEEFQILVLQLVTHAVRPLRLLEIADCIAVTQQQYGEDTGKLKEIVRLACGPLLEVLPDETVRVVHHSLIEYLLEITSDSKNVPSRFVFNKGPTHELMAMLCLSYLKPGSLDSVKLRPRQGFGERLDRKQVYTPFTNYAADSWHLHIKKAIELGQYPYRMNEMLSELLEKDEHIQKLALFANSKSLGSPDQNGRMHPAEPLRLAIKLDLTSFADSILSIRGGELIRYDGSNDESPLHLAVARGTDEMVYVLAQHAVDLDEHDLYGSTPLHTAFWYNYRARFNPAAARILLKAGADPWKDSGKNRHLHDNTILLAIHKTSKEANHALFWAVAAGQTPQVVRMILQLDLADINAKDDTERPDFPMTPLFKACLNRNPGLIKMLLHAGADPNVLHSSQETMYFLEDEDEAASKGQNALHALASGKHSDSSINRTSSDNDTRECFKLVLEANANDNDGVTALHIASTCSEDLTVALLKAGADMTRAINEGITLFHLAARSRQTNIIRLLLDWPRSGNQTESIKPLLNAKDVRGRTALYYACASGRLATVQLLLDAGAVIAAEAYDGSPWNGCVDFEDEQNEWKEGSYNLSALYGGLGNHNAGGVLISDRRRPLDRESRSGSGLWETRVPYERIDEILELLVARAPSLGRLFVGDAIAAAAQRKSDYTGADPNSADNYDKSCLYRVIDDVAVYKTLVSHGAAITPPTLLNSIILKNVGMLQLMLSDGADPNMRKPGIEKPGWTAPDGRFSTSERSDPNDFTEMYAIDYVVSEMYHESRELEDLPRQIFTMLLDHGADINAKYLRTTVMHRALSRDRSFLSSMLEHPKLDVELRDAEGLTLLLLACSHGNVIAAELLLKRGADIHARDSREKNALQHLLSNPFYTSSTSSRFTPSDPDGLKENSLQLDFLEHITRSAPDLLHQIDEDCNTPLHRALDKGFHGGRALGREVDVLLSANADVSSANKMGDTPLHILFGGSWQIDCGIDLNVRNNSGESPIFQIFRTARVHVQLPDLEGQTLRDLKTARGDDERYWKICNARERRDADASVNKEYLIWDLFEEHGVDWLVTDKKGQSVLHIVAANVTTGHRGTVCNRLSRFQFLIAKDCNIHAEDEEHRTALDVAAAMGAQDILDMFKAIG